MMTAILLALALDGGGGVDVQRRDCDPFPEAAAALEACRASCDGVDGCRASCEAEYEALRRRPAPEDGTPLPALAGARAAALEDCNTICSGVSAGAQEECAAACEDHYGTLIVDDSGSTVPSLARRQAALLAGATDACMPKTTCRPHEARDCSPWRSYDCGEPVCGVRPLCAECPRQVGPARLQRRQSYRICRYPDQTTCYEYTPHTNGTFIGCGC